MTVWVWVDALAHTVTAQELNSSVASGSVIPCAGGDARARRPGGSRLLVNTLTIMTTEPGALIRAAREALGLSTRDLAVLAGVAYPTISRIENGHEQPRWDTLEKLAAALGRTWKPALEPVPAPRLADLAHRWERNRLGDVEPDWTRWRAFADRLRRHPELIAVALVDAPPRSGSVLVDNLLAATAEKLADEMGIRRPAWARRVAPLRRPWAAPGTPRMQAEHAAATPSQFAERNITLPWSAIWRDRTLAGVSS